HNQLVFVATRPPHKIRNIKKRSPEFHDIPDDFKDSVDGEKAVTNLNIEAYFQEEERKPPLMPRSLSKPQDDESSLTQEHDYDILLVEERELPDPYKNNEFEDKSHDRLAEPQKQLNASQAAAAETLNHTISKTRKKRSSQADTNPDYFKDSADSEQAVTNVNTEAYLQEEDRKSLLMPISLSKPQDDESSLTQEQDHDILLVVERELLDPYKNDEFEDKSHDRLAEPQNHLNASQVVAAETLNHTISNTRKKRSSQADNNPDYFKDSADSEQAVTNANTDVYVQEEGQIASFTPRYLSKDKAMDSSSGQEPRSLDGDQ
ncbi:hypothetical protein AVEN_174466-1, partial [Araneus ventricosus]